MTLNDAFYKLLGKRSITLLEMQKEFILATLNRCNWNKCQAARQLGITVRTLRNYNNRLDLDKYKQILRPDLFAIDEFKRRVKLEKEQNKKTI